MYCILIGKEPSITMFTYFVSRLLNTSQYSISCLNISREYGGYGNSDRLTGVNRDQALIFRCPIFFETLKDLSVWTLPTNYTVKAIWLPLHGNSLSQLLPSHCFRFIVFWNNITIKYYFNVLVNIVRAWFVSATP